MKSALSPFISLIRKPVLQEYVLKFSDRRLDKTMRFFTPKFDTNSIDKNTVCMFGQTVGRAGSRQSNGQEIDCLDEILPPNDFPSST